MSVAAVRDVYHACAALGLLTEKTMQGLDLSPEVFEKADVRLPESTLLSLWRLLDQQMIRPGIGLAIGQTIEPSSKGLLASWVSQANTLEEAFGIFITNIELMNPSETWKIVEHGNQITLSLENNNAHAYPASAFERSMSAMVSWARTLSAHAFPLDQATFTFSAPVYEGLFLPIFGQHVDFNADSNSLSFSKELFALPVISSNELLKSIVEQKAKIALAKLAYNASLSNKVESLIRSTMSQGQTLNMERASEMLAKSRQTLYRQLKQEGTDFQTIYNDTRKVIAFDLLKEKRNTISAVSLQLGFKDTSSFYKAFRRWTGMSPKQFLEQTIKS